MTIKVVRGNPSAEELAAVLVLLSATATAAADPGPRRPRTGAWHAPHRLLRRPHAYGLAGWQSSSLPH
ncbi:acyl-CoA carboxylase subunit epsilon [Actinoplanes sp. KI2]|uniref:acyl-CoA carboxylase subunit epsilon n=1 Tax=Actinoplanes sp. KI2 TaxID=2983315 RepID=UPI0021D614BB|nr:acyl-CoA carboxylase subunit epsilon [Actinoplanes sp. KI2]MCU7724414.1 acyl-CoA carboxylase subunit epsilon [Actinoplanes sp. KI2]